MKDIEIKKKLLECIAQKLHEKINLLKGGMKRSQDEMSEHGRIENKYDTSIEESHTLKAGYAMQIGQIENVLASIQGIAPRICTAVEPGSIIETDIGAFFVSTGLLSEQIEVAKIKYDCVAINSPIIQKIQRMKAGTKEIEMNGQKIKVLRIF